jgi:hypothetical protein
MEGLAAFRSDTEQPVQAAACSHTTGVSLTVELIFPPVYKLSDFRPLTSNLQQWRFGNSLFWRNT